MIKIASKTNKFKCSLQNLQEKICYHFKDKKLLKRAITHKSFANDRGLTKSFDYNETLEFLGDAVLSLVAAESLINTTPLAKEGSLTMRRSAYVCEKYLSECAQKIDLGSVLLVGKTLKLQYSSLPMSVLADALEALFGAVYQDGGLDSARKVILSVLGPVPEKIVNTAKDSKTLAQELTQSFCGEAPYYEVISQSGLEHKKVFVVGMYLKHRKIAQGSGINKKLAEKDAARCFFDKIKGLDNKKLEHLLNGK